MKKGIAVPYIIAILLGVGVIGLVGYWLFVSGGQFGGASAKEACNRNLALWCSQWANNGYTAVWITTADANSFNVKYPECPGSITDKATPTGTDVNNAKAACQK